MSLFVSAATTASNASAKPALTAQQESKYKTEISELKDQVNY